MATRRMWNQRSSFTDIIKEENSVCFDVTLCHWLIISQYFKHNAVLENLRN